MGLSGTAIGVGVLLLPIRAGLGGLIPILTTLVSAYPIAFYCHRVLARLCFSGSNPSGNVTETAKEHFSRTDSVVITLLCFFVICPLLWIYGVTTTNTSMTFWGNQSQVPALNRDFVALFLLLLMVFVIWSGGDLMVKMASHLVWPFVASLVLISLSLVPYWSSTVIDQVDISDIALTGHDGVPVAARLGISIMAFSFSFPSIISSFVVSKCEEYEEDYGCEFIEQKRPKIISHASMLMVAVVMFFASSCLFTLSPANTADAKVQNIPVLSYLVNHFAPLSGTKPAFATALEYGASITALVTILKFLFGRCLSTLEGLDDLVLRFGYKDGKTKVSAGKLNAINMIFAMGSTWVVAYASPNTLDLIETMGVPIIASLLCLLPMYTIRKASSLTKYRGRLDNVFVTAIGLLTILNIVYRLF